MKKGSKVVITRDVRKIKNPVDGQEATFVEFAKDVVWMLLDENGKPEIESYTLPDGYIEWHADSDPFPKQKCGIKSQNPVFKLADGSTIHGGECYWEIKDPTEQAKFLAKADELMNNVKNITSTNK